MLGVRNIFTTCNMKATTKLERKYVSWTVCQETQPPSHSCEADWQPGDALVAVWGLRRGSVRMSCPLSLPFDSIVLRAAGSILLLLFHIHSLYCPQWNLTCRVCLALVEVWGLGILRSCAFVRYCLCGMRADSLAQSCQLGFRKAMWSVLSCTAVVIATVDTHIGNCLIRIRHIRWSEKSESVYRWPVVTGHSVWWYNQTDDVECVKLVKKTLLTWACLYNTSVSLPVGLETLFIWVDLFLHDLYDDMIYMTEDIWWYVFFF